MTGNYVQMVLALAALAAIVGLFAWMARKKQMAAGMMSVLSYQSIGQKNGVAALKVGDEVLILGVSPSSVSVLKTLKESDVKGVPAQYEGMHDKLRRLRQIKDKADGKLT